MVDNATNLIHNHIHITREVAEAWKMDAVVCGINSLETLRSLTRTRGVNGSVDHKNQLLPHLLNSLAKTLVIVPGFNQGLKETRVITVVKKWQLDRCELSALLFSEQRRTPVSQEGWLDYPSTLTKLGCNRLSRAVQNSRTSC